MLYNDYYLKFPDADTQKVFFDLSDEDNPINQFPELHWDIIGNIYESGTYEDQDGELIEITPPVLKEGWHANVAIDFRETFPSELEQYVQSIPETPYRIRPVKELSENKRKELSASRLQADKLMRLLGIKETVHTWLDTAPENIKSSFNLAYRFERTDPLWETVRIAFNWSELELDRFFVRAQVL